MGADVILLTGCPVKEHLGGGARLAGAERLCSLIKLRSHAEAVADSVSASGGDPDAASFRHVVTDGRSSAVRRDVSVKQARESTAVLDELGPHCEECLANQFGDPFGCVTTIDYPIPASAEAWLAQHIQPSDTLGGWLLLKSIEDFGWDGRRMAEARARGLLAASAPIEVVVKKGFLSRTTVSSAQFLEATLLFGILPPLHCMMVLLFLGVLELDGHQPTRKDELETLTRLLEVGSPDDRAERTGVVLGPASDDAGVADMQHLLAAVYTAFLLGDEVWIDP
jgi:hypothetical protein